MRHKPTQPIQGNRQTQASAVRVHVKQLMLPLNQLLSWCLSSIVTIFLVLSGISARQDINSGNGNLRAPMPEYIQSFFCQMQQCHVRKKASCSSRCRVTRDTAPVQTRICNWSMGFLTAYNLILRRLM